MVDIRNKLREYRRVIQVARKPGREEFTSSAKVTSIGLVVIGLIGFVIFIGCFLSGVC